MITADYCRMMARYNRWQNNGIRAAVGKMDEADLTKERGAFFGSIFRTLNHLLWGAREVEQLRGHLVDALVGALGRQQDGDEQRIGVGVIQRHGRLGVQPLKFIHDVSDLFCFIHRNEVGWGVLDLRK